MEQSTSSSDDDTKVGANAENCLVSINNNTDEVMSQFDIVFTTKGDPVGKIVVRTDIAARSIDQYVISGFCVKTCGGSSHYDDGTNINHDVFVAGPNECIIGAPFGVSYGANLKVASKNDNPSMQSEGKKPNP